MRQALYTFKNNSLYTTSPSSKICVSSYFPLFPEKHKIMIFSYLCKMLAHLFFKTLPKKSTLWPPVSHSSIYKGRPAASISINLANNIINNLK